MPAPLLAIAAIGTIAKSYGEYLAAKAEAAQLREKSQVSLLQGEETLHRAELNIAAIQKEGGRFGGEQIAQYAGAGVDVGSEATLSAMEDTAMAISDEIFKKKSEAAFEYKMYMREAQSYQKAARDTEKAGTISALGGGALGFARLNT